MWELTCGETRSWPPCLQSCTEGILHLFQQGSGQNKRLAYVLCCVTTVLIMGTTDGMESYNSFFCPQVNQWSQKYYLNCCLWSWSRLLTYSGHTAGSHALLKQVGSVQPGPGVKGQQVGPECYHQIFLRCFIYCFCLFLFVFNFTTYRRTIQVWSLFCCCANPPTGPVHLFWPKPGRKQSTALCIMLYIIYTRLIQLVARCSPFDFFYGLQDCQ